MDYSNVDYPVNIQQIYEYIFKGQQFNDSKKRGKLDTIRKNIVGLHAIGLIEINRNLWRDFLSFPYFTGFLAP